MRRLFQMHKLSSSWEILLLRRRKEVLENLCDLQSSLSFWSDKSSRNLWKHLKRFHIHTTNVSFPAHLGVMQRRRSLLKWLSNCFVDVTKRLLWLQLKYVFNDAEPERWKWSDDDKSNTCTWTERDKLKIDYRKPLRVVSNDVEWVEEEVSGVPEWRWEYWLRKTIRN